MFNKQNFRLDTLHNSSHPFKVIFTVFVFVALKPEHCQKNRIVTFDNISSLV